MMEPLRPSSTCSSTLQLGLALICLDNRVQSTYWYLVGNGGMGEWSTIATVLTIITFPHSLLSTSSQVHFWLSVIPCDDHSESTVLQILTVWTGPRLEIAGGLRNKDLDGDGQPMPVLVGHDETIHGYIMLYHVISLVYGTSATERSFRFFQIDDTQSEMVWLL